MTHVFLFFLLSFPWVGAFIQVGHSRKNVRIKKIVSFGKSGSPLCPPLDDVTEENVATFAMGWFWGPQRDFDRTHGVIETIVGYSGATDPESRFPTYRNIQDYAEAIRVRFDDRELKYDDLLDMFFAFHTPAPIRFTGSQYRSAIFYNTPSQKLAAERRLKQEGTLGQYVSLEQASEFYRAEEYHQKYLHKASSYR